MNKSLNNKGMTLVELIVAFSILMIIMLGIFNLTVTVREELNHKAALREVSEFSSFINNKIHYNLLKDKPFVIAYKESDNSAWNCTYENGSSCKADNYLDIFYQGKNATSDALKTMCSGTYPCIVYGYLDDNNIKFKTIFMRNNDKKGISHDGVFKALPNIDNITLKDDLKIEVKNKLFVIDYPIYLNNSNKSYGFKIAYPFIK